MELDTGATVSIMGKQVFDTLFPELQIHPSSVALKTYTGEPMEVLGEATVCHISTTTRTGATSSYCERNWTFINGEKLALPHHVRLGIYQGCVAAPEVSRRVAGEISGHL